MFTGEPISHGKISWMVDLPINGSHGIVGSWLSGTHQNLCKVGDRVMLAIPSDLLKDLHLKAGAKVGVSIDNGLLVIQPQPKPSYSLDELLAQCDGSQEIEKEDQEWFDLKPLGDELL